MQSDRAGVQYTWRDEPRAGARTDRWNLQRFNQQLGRPDVRRTQPRTGPT